MSTDPSAPGAASAGGPSSDSGLTGPGPGDPGPGGPGPGGQPSEEELRVAYEAELARITSTDMMLQSAVSLLNVASYRLMPRPAAGAGGAEQPGAGQDLEQVRDAIDGVRALLDILERRVPSELRPLRDALSQLQMAYAREAQATGQAVGGETAAGGAPSAGTAAQPASPAGGATPPGASPGAGAPGPADGSQGQGDPAQTPDEQGKRGPGPAESSGRLWVPGR